MTSSTSTLIDTRALQARGFDTVQLLDDDEVALLHDWLGHLDLRPDDPFFATSAHADRPIARAADQLIKEIFQPRLDLVLPGYEGFLGSFAYKGVGGGFVDLHQDLTNVDERTHRSYMVWCALMPMGETEGTLHVIPGSHRWTNALRPMGERAGLLSRIDDKEAWALTVPLPLQGGEAVVYDAALVHGSTPNRGQEPREAAALVIAPRDEPLVYFHAGDGRGPVRGYTVDESFFTVEPFGAVPVGRPEVEPWAPPVAPLDADGFAQLRSRLGRRRSWRARLSRRSK